MERKKRVLIVEGVYNNVKILGIATPYINKKGSSVERYFCLCHCGKTFCPTKYRILNPAFSSCGCLRLGKCINSRKTHGCSNELIYRIWAAMTSRCFNRNNKAYKHYGGRGITVCEKWLNPENFIEWALKNGYKKGLTIDRIENNIGYNESNCRFVSMVVQNNNKRNSIHVNYKNESMGISEWARKLKLNNSSLYYWYFTKRLSFDDAIRKSSHL